MKFDDHLAAFLYQNKTLTLEGIGVFTLDEKVRVPSELEKEIFYPIEGLAFAYNPKSNTDENIISFLVKKLGKIEPLVRSDLEYYLSHIKQFLNIGNPYTIEGVGTLSKNNSGIYEFTPGNFLPVKEDLHPKRENTDHNYPVKSRRAGGKIFVIILICIIIISALAAIGWGVYGYIGKRTLSGTARQQNIADSIRQKNTVTITKDTVQAVDPTVAANKAIVIKADAVSYRMIFEITKSKDRANSRTTQLRNLNSSAQYDSIPVNDSTAYYRLFLLMNVSPADTSRIKDSLRVFFGKRIFVEKVAE